MRMHFQICQHTGPSCHPDHRDSVDHSEGKEILRRFIRTHFPNVDPSGPVIEERCMYSVRGIQHNYSAC